VPWLARDQSFAVVLSNTRAGAPSGVYSECLRSFDGLAVRKRTTGFDFEHRIGKCMKEEFRSSRRPGGAVWGGKKEQGRSGSGSGPAKLFEASAQCVAVDAEDGGRL